MSISPSIAGRDAAPSTQPDGRTGFDFLIGRWRVRHRRLQRRLEGDTSWDAFDGTCEARAILGGLGNIDDNVVELPAGPYRAVTVRLFDPATRLWSIWWVDGRKAAFDPPVYGTFRNGVGTFYGDDVCDGRPIHVRFVWSRITAVSAHWEQAFSANAGATWETNWHMAFERTA